MRQMAVCRFQAMYTELSSKMASGAPKKETQPCSASLIAPNDLLAKIPSAPRPFFISTVAPLPVELALRREHCSPRCRPNLDTKLLVYAIAPAWNCLIEQLHCSIFLVPMVAEFALPLLVVHVRAVQIAVLKSQMSRVRSINATIAILYRVEL